MQAPQSEAEHTARAGMLYAVGAYGLWGVVPLYWKMLTGVPAVELVGPRIVWTALMLIVILAVAGRAREIRVRNTGLAIRIVIAAILIAVNWGVFIHAVQTDQLLATSLGYYITPLVSVVLGLVVLGERLRPVQIVSVLIAGAGVMAYAAQVGSIPLISLVLAFSFGLYGLVHKLTPQAPLPGLAREMIVLTPFALGHLAWLAWSNESTLATASYEIHGLVALSGIVTAAPLLLFRAATARLALVSVGMFQYIAPTVTLVLAVALFNEPFSTAYGLAFTCVWIGLGMFSFDALRQKRSTFDSM